MLQLDRLLWSGTTMVHHTPILLTIFCTARSHSFGAHFSRPALSCCNLFLNASHKNGSHVTRWWKSCTRTPAHNRVLLGCSGVAANGWRAPQFSLACCNLSLKASSRDTQEERRWPQSCTERQPDLVRTSSAGFRNGCFWEYRRLTKCPINRINK